MFAYVYKAALYCEPCGEAIRAREPQPANPHNDSTFDSDAWPKGPFADGGGEADSPQHCDACGKFLENPLTDDGREYVREALQPIGCGFGVKDSDTLNEWARFYADALGEEA